MNEFFKNLNLLKLQLNTKTEQTLARILFINSIQISVAESCTGGLIASRLTDVSGSSNYLKESFITYSEEAKKDILGVSEETLKNFGVISEECAIEMAEGLFKRGNSDICVSITGIAGSSEAFDKPTGTAFIAIKTAFLCKTRKLNLNPNYNRKTLKYLFSQETLEFLIEFLNTTYAAMNV